MRLAIAPHHSHHLSTKSFGGTFAHSNVSSIPHYCVSPSRSLQSPSLSVPKHSSSSSISLLTKKHIILACVHSNLQFLSFSSFSSSPAITTASSEKEQQLRQQNTKEIAFYRENGHCGFLSNYYVRFFTVDGVKYQSNEHYFQSRKHRETATEERVRNAATPDQSKKIANSQRLSNEQLEKWEKSKDEVMLKGLRCKFAQHKDLAQKLLDTGDSILIEDTTKDYYWGRGSDGTGKNMLGILLMQVRQELKDNKLDLKKWV